ncbi:hypothetical protein BOTBODRAFT_362460 [Botryobasidium botryosum FD-172 SS1]|uniref:Uncharacterized protein n=1 Tax=Botryobasidium botryosum (strain FD-172 SS1) TaxID=930990 RepID=A0A067MEA7_BOTB1|nr:hypothetical protein BOTBODRAFT_362460 [Botryobasidium botryosum FD-172 SS1]
MLRAVVNVITTIFGTLLGVTLTAIAVRHFQAGAWATIAEAQGGNDSVTISEFDAFATGGLLVAPWSLLKRRLTKDQTHSSRYPWTLNIFIFLLLIALSKGIFFLLERTIIITSNTAQQPNGVFYNVSVVGDLTPQDLLQAQQTSSLIPDDNPYIASWLAASFAGVVRTPSVQRLYENDTVFFSEVLPGQLLPNAQGPGTFNQSEGSFTPAEVSNATPAAMETTDLRSGQLIRWPRWGIRLTCQSLPNPTLHLVPFSPSGTTYVYLTYSFMNSLGASLRVTVPPMNLPWDASQLYGNDTLPSGLDPATIWGTYTEQDDGSSHSGAIFFPPDIGTAGHGFTFVDVHLARVGTSYAPNGSFLASALVNGTQIGYDVVACLQVIEPWVLQVYNRTGGAPYTTDYITPGASTGTVNETAHPGVASSLNSTASWVAYNAAYYIARRSMLGPPALLQYAPTPMLVGFTGGSGPNGYASLSPSRMESIIGAWDSSQALPYLVGSGYIAAQASDDQITAVGAVEKRLLALILVGLLLFGVVADVCIPMLPRGMPLRDFSVLASITIARPALLKLDDWDLEAKRGPDSVLSGVGPEFNMNLEKLKGHIGDVPTHPSVVDDRAARSPVPSAT